MTEENVLIGKGFQNVLVFIWKGIMTMTNQVVNLHYICIVHTVVLFQSLAGIYCQTQHVEY
jgi:hypothetical protein